MAMWLILIFLLRESMAVKYSDLRASIPGDVTIGGLIAIHLPGDAGDCSVLSNLRGIEALEALLFSIDTINANTSFLPNITLGVKAFDTCGSKRAALDHAVKEFVPGHWRKSRAGSCKDDDHSVIGVIGPTYSSEAVKTTEFLNLFEIPLISFAATTRVLSEKSQYEYFSRTVASDEYQALAIVDLLVHFNWTYVSVVYSNEIYGRNGYAEIKKVAGERGIHIANENKKIHAEYNKNNYPKVVEAILSDPMANVIVLFAIETVLTPLLEELQKQAGNRTLQLVGSETFGAVINREQQKLHKIAERGIFLHQSTARIEEFNKYFFSLSPNSNKRNPWFQDFFQEIMNCSFENTSGKNQTYKKLCEANMTLRDANYSIFLGELSLMPAVVDGVYAFAHALRNILIDRCPDRVNKSCISPNKIPGKELLNAIRTQMFWSPSGHEVNFTGTGDIKAAAYDVYYTSEVGERNNKNLKIARWTEDKLTFYLKQWPTQFIPPTSSCVKQCSADEIRIKNEEKPRQCWKCRPCSQNAFPINDTDCEKCQEGHLPDRKARTCVRIMPKYFSLNGTGSFSYAAFFSVLLSALGISAVCFVAVVFVKFRNTPLVKASARELSCLLLIGLFLSFLYSFVAVSEPCPANCLFLFVFDSLPFTISYVAVAVKNNRTFRIFNPDRDLTVRPTLVRPTSQIMVSLGLVSFQVLLLTALIILSAPCEKYIYPSRNEVHHICYINNTQLVLSQVYNAILLIACTYYGFKTRNIPRNFNEAKYIAFAMYSSCVTAIAFGLMTFMIPDESHSFDRVVVTCFRITLMAGMLLVCFFAPKIYIIIWRAEKNTKHASAKSTPGSDQEGSVPEQSRSPKEALNSIGVGDIHMKKTVNTVSRATQTDWI